MRRKSFENMECGIAQALEMVGDPWSLLIVRDALFGIHTFDGFYQNLGIPRNTLTERLQHLVTVGILSRKAHPQDGRRIDYRIAEPGEELLVTLLALSQWGNKWAFGDEGAPSYVADRKNGRPVAELRARNTAGKPLGLKDVTMIPGPSASERLKAAFTKL